MAETAQTTQQSSGVTKLLPILLPVIAIAIVAFLGYRWYSSQTEQQVEVPEIPPKVEIESLNDEDQQRLQNIARGISDFKSVKLESVQGEGTGQVRYEVADGKLYASIITALAPLKAGERYQVWLKASDGTDWQESAQLAENKSGYTSTFVFPEDKLPVEIKITHEGVAGAPADQEIILFQGTVSPEA